MSAWKTAEAPAEAVISYAALVAAPPWLAKSFAYANMLKPKPTKKQAA